MKIRRLPVLHIEGYKEQSITTAPKEFLKPEHVYIPTLLPSPMDVKVEVGDHVLLGEVIMESRGRFPYPVLSPISGTVTGKVKKWYPSNKMSDMLEITNDFKEETVDTFKNLDPENMTREELVEIMKKSGLVGQGGAGFPAYVKYSTTEKVDMVIINLAECEPFITCDYTCVLYNAQLFIYGFRYLLKAADCNQGIIAIKDKDINAKDIDYLTPLLDSNMRIELLEDVYPAGWERYTVETISHKTYKALPIEAGVIVSNASTCYSFARMLKEGIPPTVKYLTITGDAVKNSGNVLAKIGSSIPEIVELFGGLKEGHNPENTHIIAGGPMTGKSMFFPDFITTQTLGAVIFLENKNKDKKQLECLGCGRCAERCPSFLTPVEIKKELAVGNIEELKKLNVTKCIQCGLCSFVCPSRIDLTYSVGKAKEMVLRLGRK